MLELEVNRVFNCSARTLFEAIGKGMLFEQTDAIENSVQIDFRVGGDYFIGWLEGGSQVGEFTSIEPYRRIAFSWNYKSSVTNRETSTLVTILLTEEDSSRCRLTLKHEGFEVEEQTKGHTEGWEEALERLQAIDLV